MKAFARLVTQTSRPLSSPLLATTYHRLASACANTTARKFVTQANLAPAFQTDSAKAQGYDVATPESAGAPVRSTSATEIRLKPTDVMTFGKYKGLPYSRIPESYVEWMANNGILNRNPALRDVFVRLGKIEPWKPFTYNENLAGVLNKSEKIPYDMCGYSLEAPANSTRRTGLFGDTTPSWRELTPEAKAALEPYMEVPAALPRNVVFFDLESVYVTDISDIANSYICQIGAMDGAGNEFLLNINPPCDFYSVSKLSPFFVEYGFQRFFTSENPNFAAGWPKFAEWLFSANNGRDIANAPVIMIGHNIVRYDLQLLDQELRRISPVELSGARPLARSFSSPNSTSASAAAAAAASARSAIMPPPGFPTWRDQFFQHNNRFFDTFLAMPRFTGLPWSPGKGAWSLSNLHNHATSKPMRGLAHDALVDVSALRDIFFSSNILGAFFRAELARCLERPYLPEDPVFPEFTSRASKERSTATGTTTSYQGRATDSTASSAQSPEHQVQEQPRVRHEDQDLSPFSGEIDDTNESPEQPVIQFGRSNMPSPPPPGGSSHRGFISE